VSKTSLDEALRGAERVLLDTSMLLAFHSQHEAAHPLAKHVMERVESGVDPMRTYYSVVSATEPLFREFRWVYLGEH
jgi:hypothetical protein